ncbi:MAG TPA: hypothetical protein VIT92_16160 [Burkholderiaceae bacterium]
MRGLTLLISAAVPLALAACGGGAPGAAGGAAVPAPQVSQSPLTPLFAATVVTAAHPADVALKACIFTAKQMGKPAQGGEPFLESLTVELLPEATAPLYNALTGQVDAHTKRAFKGSDGKVGAPPRLYSGVAGKVGESYVGFGAPCGAGGPMTNEPPGACYWIADKYNGQVHVANSYGAIGEAMPETSSGAKLANPTWTATDAYVFWYEVGPGQACSVPGSTAIFAGLVRKASS